MSRRRAYGWARHHFHFTFLLQGLHTVTASLNMFKRLWHQTLNATLCVARISWPSGDFADGFGSRRTGGESGLAHRISALPVAGRRKLPLQTLVEYRLAHGQSVPIV